MSSITLSGVGRSYGAVRVLDDVSLNAPEGRVLALLGPSGSGKSTILRVIAGLEPVDSGEVRIGAEVLTSKHLSVTPEARRIGMVFQDYALFPHMSVAANVQFGIAHLPQETRIARAEDWLARVGLTHRARAYPHELSGGEQQRIALARAMAPAPRAILLDEPFSGLDPALRGELREVTLAALKETQTTALFVTHDAEEALLVADRLVVLKAGRVLQEAAPREAYNHPATLDVAAALGPINIFEGIVADGALATPFGPIAAAHLPEGANAAAAVRAEAITLSPGVDARVLDIRPHGAHDLVRIEAGGAVWRALIAPPTALGDTVAVQIQASGAFSFSA